MHGRSSAADSKREIHIVDAEPGVVKAALGYIYTGSLVVNQGEPVPPSDTQDYGVPCLLSQDPAKVCWVIW